MDIYMVEDKVQKRCKIINVRGSRKLWISNR